MQLNCITTYSLIDQCERHLCIIPINHMGKRHWSRTSNWIITCNFCRCVWTQLSMTSAFAPMVELTQREERSTRREGSTRIIVCNTIKLNARGIHFLSRGSYFNDGSTFVRFIVVNVTQLHYHIFSLLPVWTSFIHHPHKPHGQEAYVAHIQ